jgi:stage II sporulation protein Q
MVPEVISMKSKEPNANNQISSFEKAKRRLKWKKLMSKKWFFPAVYLFVAALILSVAWWYQDHQVEKASKTTRDLVEQNLPQEPIPTNPTDDDMVLPVAKNAHANKTMGFYKQEDPEASRESSLNQYANTFTPHSGVDFAKKDGGTFDVVAALEGKVVKVEENPVVGWQVVIQHESGIQTIYQSLDDVRVKNGQTVKKGQVIAKAGRNRFEKEAGVHLHFEIRDRNQKAINPDVYLSGEK